MTTLVPLTRDGIHSAVFRALYGTKDELRQFPVALQDAIADEANIAADLFLPELGYLTTEAELDRVFGLAVHRACLAAWDRIVGVFSDELTRVPPPEFVAPPAGSWVAERWFKDDGPRTWHRASGDIVDDGWKPPRSWPAIRARCGHRLRASWRDDGSLITEIRVAENEPVAGTCGSCRRLQPVTA